MPLTDTAIRAVKTSEKQQKLYDGNGLFLLLPPSGSKIWRFKYRFQGKEKLISFGHYPAVSLKDAREKAAEARKTLGGGKDPSAERKESKLQLANSFELLAREWHGKQSLGWGDKHRTKIMRYMEKNLFPYIGSRPVGEAKIFCQQQGGRLPRINNSDKMAFETAQDNKITHIDGIGAPGEPWPSVLPTDNYWTGTESLEYHGNWWVIVRDRGGNVNVLINNQRQNLRVVCVP